MEAALEAASKPLAKEQHLNQQSHHHHQENSHCGSCRRADLLLPCSQFLSFWLAFIICNWVTDVWPGQVKRGSTRQVTPDMADCDKPSDVFLWMTTQLCQIRSRHALNSSRTEQGGESQDSPTLISGEQIRRQPSWIHCFPLPQSLSSLHSMLQMADEQKYVVKSSSLTISE